MKITGKAQTKHPFIRSALVVTVAGILLLSCDAAQDTRENHRSAEPKVLDGGQKTAITESPKQCLLGSAVYRNDDSFPAADGCNSCLCMDGVISCTKMYCGPVEP